MMAPELVASVERFASAIAPLDEHALETALPEPPDAAPLFQNFADYPRDMIFAAYQRLCELAARSAGQRAARHPRSLAQRILGQHQFAYRDLTGALLSVPDDALDREPADGEWSIRATLQHMLMAESGFRMAIAWALQHPGTPELTLDQFDTQAALRQSRERYPCDGDLAAFHVTVAAVHALAQDAFGELSDSDLERPLVWWDSIMPIRDLFLGFDSHMREHTVQLDKTILRLGVTVTEGARLARLVHRALGECESAMLGAPAFVSSFHEDIAKQFALWNSILPA